MKLRRSSSEKWLSHTEKSAPCGSKCRPLMSRPCPFGMPKVPPESLARRAASATARSIDPPERPLVGWPSSPAGARPRIPGGSRSPDRPGTVGSGGPAGPWLLAEASATRGRGVGAGGAGGAVGVGAVGAGAGVSRSSCVPFGTLPMLSRFSGPSLRTAIFGPTLMRSFPEGSGGGGVGRGAAAAAGGGAGIGLGTAAFGASCRMTEPGGMKTRSFFSSVAGSISSRRFGDGGCAMRIISRVRWTAAEMRNPCRWSNRLTLLPATRRGQSVHASTPPRPRATVRPRGA